MENQVIPKTRTRPDQDIVMLFQMQVRFVLTFLDKCSTLNR